MSLQQDPTYQGSFSSPIGKFCLETTETHLIRIALPGQSIPEPTNAKPSPAAKQILEIAKLQILEYLGGKRLEFDIPLAPKGTDFQRRVWKELTQIPYGKTLSYGEIAKRLKHPKAARAVGSANNKNPLPLVIPCHRVVGTNGQLVGYAGGLELKATLLEIELTKMAENHELTHNQPPLRMKAGVRHQPRPA